MIASIFIHGGNDCRQQSIQIDLERGARLGLLFGGGEKTELMAFGGRGKVKSSHFVSSSHLFEVSNFDHTFSANKTTVPCKLTGGLHWIGEHCSALLTWD